MGAYCASDCTILTDAVMSGSPPFVALWSDGARRLNLLTQSRHKADQPLPTNIPACAEVECFLPQLAEVMPRPETGRWLLLLEPSLPPSWQTLLWERLTLGGQPLGRQAVVVRHAVWGDAVKAPSSVVQATRYINFFPKAEHHFALGLQKLISANQLGRITLRYLAQDGAGSRDLFILAHGDAQGLLDVEGRPFNLPEMHPMPERIWLLACNVDGAMDRLAATLMTRGCRTVVAAVGELSAPQMQTLIKAWVMRDVPQTDPASWLAARSVEQDDGGAQALTVWGALPLDTDVTSAWNRRAWDIRHGTCDELPLDESITESGFRAAHEAMQSPSTWPMAREEMAPPLLWLAEKFHHPALSHLEREVENLLGASPSSLALHALAATARRLGHYPATARYLTRSLALPDQSDTSHADSLGHLANLFIDLDLPGAALEAIAQHQDLDIADSADRRSAAFRRLDWQARAEARKGRYQIALTHLKTKRRRAIEDEKYDGCRELAGMLYLAAWGGRAGVLEVGAIAPLAQEVQQQILAADPTAIGAGNADEKYLLRALAAWGWAVNDMALLDQVASWRPVAAERLAEHDPGPWAYVLIFLHLAGKAGKPDCDCAFENLVRAGYLLEAALFASLCTHSRAGDWLRRFQQRREKTLAELKPAHNVDADEVEARSIAESAALGRVREMAQSGVLPL